MVEHVLVPFDGSPLSERALKHAIENYTGTAITTICVINPIESVFAAEAGGLPRSKSWFENARAEAEAVHSTARATAERHGRELDCVTVAGKPARAILEYADENDIDHIVMGSHGRDGIERAILGSVAETVLRRARVPVTIVR